MDSSNDCCYEDELIILREKVELLGTKFRTLREDLDNEFNECKQKKHEEEEEEQRRPLPAAHADMSTDSSEMAQPTAKEFLGTPCFKDLSSGGEEETAREMGLGEAEKQRIRDDMVVVEENGILTAEGEEVEKGKEGEEEEASANLEEGEIIPRLPAEFHPVPIPLVDEDAADDRYFSPQKSLKRVGERLEGEFDTDKFWFLNQEDADNAGRVAKLRERFSRPQVQKGEVKVHPCRPSIPSPPSMVSKLDTRWVNQPTEPKSIFNRCELESSSSSTQSPPSAKRVQLTEVSTGPEDSDWEDVEEEEEEEEVEKVVVDEVQPLTRSELGKLRLTDNQSINQSINKGHYLIKNIIFFVRQFCASWHPV